MIINISQPSNIKNFIDRECQPFTFEIEQSPSLMTEDVNSYKGSFFTLYSKNRNKIALIDRNILTPTTVLEKEIFDITDTGYISSFKFKPKKDEITRIGYTSFHIITTVQFDTIETSNDFSTIFGANYNYINMFAVYDEVNTSYRYFKRTAISGISFTDSFEEFPLDYFKDQQNSAEDLVALNKPSRTIVYKCRLEKCLMNEISKINNSTEPEKHICKCSECGKTHSITDVMKAYLILLFIDAFSGMFSSLVGGGYSKETWDESNKVFSILESLNCCNSNCDKC